MKFQVKTWKLKDVGWLPRLMTAFAMIIAFLIGIVIYILIFIGNQSMYTGLKSLCYGLTTCLSSINFVLWLRFLRVQNQVKAQKETNSEIIKALSRSRRDELILIVLLVVLTCLGALLHSYLGRKEVGLLTIIIFISQFVTNCIYLAFLQSKIWKMNLQFEQLFKSQ